MLNVLNKCDQYRNTYSQVSYFIQFLLVAMGMKGRCNFEQFLHMVLNSQKRQVNVIIIFIKYFVNYYNDQHIERLHGLF